MQQFNADTDEWASKLDPNAPASDWTPEVLNLAARMSTVFQENADQVQHLGLLSQDPTLADFASMAAQYQRAYVQSLATYMPADNYLNSVAADLVVAVDQACRAAAT